MTRRQQFLGAIAHPQIAYILMSLGMLGLTIELWNPGAVLPGVAGGVCLLLAFFAFQILPVNTIGLLLILFGLALLILELKVPSFGALGIGGTVSLVVGSVMMTRNTVPGVDVGLGVIVPVALGVAAIFLFLGRLALAAQRRPPVTGKEGMLGAIGRARDPLERGRSRLRRHPRRDLARRRAAIRSRRAQPVRVIAVDGLTLIVEAHRTPHRARRSLLMTLSPMLILAIVLVLYLFSSIQILAEYERGVIFRLGKLLPPPKGPGVVLVFRPIDRIVRISLRTVVHDVPPQDIITRDNVSVKVNAVVYFRVVDPRRAVVEVENYLYATSQLAQTTLRSVLGHRRSSTICSPSASG